MSLVSKIVSTISSQQTATFIQSGAHYDFAIGGLPFLAAAGARLGPYQIADLKRETAPFRKEQIDQSSDVGEQSLNFWWLRSQSSFHGGAGQQFLDGNGDTSPLRVNRFDNSRGVDVWTPGRVRVLPGLAVHVPSVNVSLLIQAYQGYMYVNSADQKLYYRQGFGTTAPSVVNDTGGTSTAWSLVSDGTNYYISRSNGVWRGPLDNSAPSVQICTNTTGLLLGWVKSRLMATYGNNLYVLDPNASAAATPAPFYTHPVANWTWNAFAEGPQGIYAGGFTFAGTKSAIFRIGITVASGTPVLQAPLQVVELPNNETLKDGGLLGVVGTFLVIGTSEGVRIGTMNSDGSVTLGDLTITGELLNGPGGQWQFRGVAAKDRFVYVASKGSGPYYPNDLCLLRIDLSLQTAPTRYAWASDQNAGAAGASATCHNLVFDIAGNAVLATDSGIFHTDTLPCDSSFLITSRIRYSTSDPKVFERLRCEADGGGNGNINFYVFDSQARYPSTYGQLTPSAGRVAEFRVEDSYTSKVGQFLQVEVDLFESTNVSLPDLTFRSYQLKALPGQKRQRLLALPLMCYDNERDTAGNLIGGDASAFRRLRALEALEEAGAPVLYQRFGPNGVTVESRTVVIDDVLFILRDQPNMQDSWGGVIMCTVRTVD